MYKRKFCKGVSIRTLDELAKQKFIICNEKVYHCGWFMSWQFRLVKTFMDRGCLYYAVKVKEQEELREVKE